MKIIERLIVAALCVLPFQTLAQVDGDPATENVPRVVPYDGVLNLDGQLYDGVMDMRFNLYGAPDGGEPVWREIWSEEAQQPVTMTAGRFSVNLGVFISIEDAILDAGALFLAIDLRIPGSRDWIPLGGRQRINPVPYAMWSASAADLAVAGDLEVSGNATVARQLRVAGPLMVGTNANWVQAMRYDSGNQRLFVAEDISAVLGSTQITGPLTLDGTTEVIGGATFQSRPRFEDGFYANGLAYFRSQMRISGDMRFFDAEADAYLRMINYDADNGRLVLASDGARGGTTVGSDLRVNENVVIDETLQVDGDVRLNDCRICLNFRDDDGDYRKGACVRMVAGSHSGYVGFASDISGDDQFSLAFVCDGGGNYSGSSNVTP